MEHNAKISIPTERGKVPIPTTGVLVSALDLERLGVLKTHAAYLLAKEGRIPHYRIGQRLGGIRFIVSEVLDALRRPVGGR